MKEDLKVKIAFWTIVIAAFLLVAFIFNLPKLWASDWNFKCLFTECRRV